MLETAVLLAMLIGPVLPLFAFGLYLGAKPVVRVYELLLIGLATTGTTVLTCYFLSHFAETELSLPSENPGFCTNCNKNDISQHAPEGIKKRFIDED